MPDTNLNNFQPLQNYDSQGGPQQAPLALPPLRAKLAALGLDGMIVPHDDAFQNEYLPACNERLAWATGFTGSAGAAIILADKAHLFADGRYSLQSKTQTDPNWIDCHNYDGTALASFLANNIAAGAKIGYDPALTTPDDLAKFKAAGLKKQISLVPLDQNPIDQVWAERPLPPKAKASAHPIEYAGESSESKRTRLGQILADNGQDCAIITSPAALVWLLNIRGGDVVRSPLVLGYAILFNDGRVDGFIDPDKLDDATIATMGKGVRIRPEADFLAALSELSDHQVMLDPASASALIFQKLEDGGALISRGRDITALPRAKKNPIEQEGTRRAHIRDGAAIVRFLHWFAENAQDGSLTEIDACKALEGFRHQTGALKDLSFDSISGAGPNGAIVHYRVSHQTNGKIKPNSLFLIDSGGQYLDGTTDITRTLPVGEVDGEMADRFTRVLKGHIALGMVRFPAGTTGSALDALARVSLWAAGLDYDHGTGHGVGSYLGVHEGPHRIAKVANDVGLEPGMIVSNEPGYYKTGHWGIRIENLQMVSEPSIPCGGERPMMGFETLTMAPIDRRLIVTGLLNHDELSWLNRYHETVLSALMPLLTQDDDGPVRAFLEKMCAPIIHKN